ncbi:MAG: TetR/AcrR family transcriptional regulator [Nonomuraea sp.]|nr:TetR/AcrR family transcriptional regulator [Nonomuraea sp.]
MTSRAQILAAARALIDRDGWEKLTIRRLAAELGIGATTLYHHIRDKEDLLVLLLNQHVDQIERPDLPADPRSRILAAATAMHDALAEWPWAAEVLTVDGFVGRLDASSLWIVEAIVAGAGDYGCSDAEAVDLFRGVWYYTVGEILVRSRSGQGRVAGSFDGLDASLVPRLAAIGARWPELAARDSYARGLRALVDGLLER